MPAPRRGFIDRRSCPTVCSRRRRALPRTRVPCETAPDFWAANPRSAHRIPVKNTATLLIDCPDRKGNVAAVSEFLYRHNANILHADQHQDAEGDLFFMRVEWV